MGCGLGWAQGIVLDGSPWVLMDVAMATNFGTQFAISGFMALGCNFGCMIASDMLFDSRGGFSDQAIRRKHSQDRVSKSHCHSNQFWD